MEGPIHYQREPEDFVSALTAGQLLLARAKRVAVLTGAGVSAESGISTFRDASTGAVWDRFDPRKLATMDGFLEDPGLVWDWYMTRIKQAIEDARPNPGHIALGELEKYCKVTVITQNVDDLHELGGSHDVIHLHGDLATSRCLDDCGWAGPTLELDLQPGTVPKCPACGEMARPNVVWFGEMLPKDALQAADDAIKSCDLMIVAGTSGQVFPAADLPWDAKFAGASIISINTRPEDHFGGADVRITSPSGVALRKLLEVLTP